MDKLVDTPLNFEAGGQETVLNAPMVDVSAVIWPPAHRDALWTGASEVSLRVGLEGKEHISLGCESFSGTTEKMVEDGIKEYIALVLNAFKERLKSPLIH